MAFDADFAGDLLGAALAFVDFDQTPPAEVRFGDGLPKIPLPSVLCAPTDALFLARLFSSDHSASGDCGRLHHSKIKVMLCQELLGKGHGTGGFGFVGALAKG